MNSNQIYARAVNQIASVAVAQHTIQNPVKGDRWRTTTNEQLLALLRQNVDELELALKYGNDVKDKAADVVNFVAYLLGNHLFPQAPES